MKQADRAGTIATYEYDAANRITARVLQGIRTEFAYDACGNLVSRTFGNLTTRYQYDQANRLIAMIDPAGNETRRIRTPDILGRWNHLAEAG